MEPTNPTGVVAEKKIRHLEERLRSERRSGNIAEPQAKTVASAVSGDAISTSIYSTGIRRAIDVIGSESEAVRWMGTPVRALNYATPISLLHDQAGLEAVETVLGRLEHGIL